MQGLIDQLKKLEASSQQLDPRSEEFLVWMGQIADYGARYLAGLENQPALRESTAQAIRRGFEEQGQGLPEALAYLDEHVLSSGINATSGNFLGYIPGGGIPTAAIGDFLAALTNRYAGVYAAGPGAAEIENECIRWMCELVRFGDSAWGTLQSGGTLSTLMALAAARDSRPTADWPRGVVYLTDQTHHCLEKCLKVLGLAETKRVWVATDRANRMSVDDLRTKVAADRLARLLPWIVCINAGTTNSGAVDPIADVLEVCRKEGMWGHVDAAYGGFFLLTERGRHLLGGLGDADSIVLDPHKALFLPYGCGAVLVKDAELLKRSFASSADYLADVEEQGGISASDYSLEGTRHFRGLRLWLSLTVNGLARYRSALEEKLLLARYAHEQLQAIAGIEVGPEPELSCVVFRAAAGDAATKVLLGRIVKRGKVYVSSTRLNGTLHVRFCLLCFRTHLEHVDRALEEVATCIAS
jgi:glutamate/tyrosine decarboxylase-like PLP-dependent enzyme